MSEHYSGANWMICCMDVPVIFGMDSPVIAYKFGAVILSNFVILLGETVNFNNL